MLDFVGIGAQKAGTSWLYEGLKRHPRVEFPAGKEIHFWDKKRDLGIGWYRAQFPEQGDGMRSGEITPAYALLDAHQIRELHELNPELRLLFVLRNPIDRAWSSALMAVGRAEMLVEEASDQWFVDHFLSQGSLRRGDYLTTIKRWLAVFRRDQLLILLFDQIANDPRALLGRVAVHIGVDPEFYDGVPDEVLRKRVFEGTGTPIRPSLRRVLEGIYRDKIEETSLYLDVTLDGNDTLCA